MIKVSKNRKINSLFNFIYEIVKLSNLFSSPSSSKLALFFYCKSKSILVDEIIFEKLKDKYILSSNKNEYSLKNRI